MPRGKKKKNTESQNQPGLATKSDDSQVQKEGLAAEEDTDNSLGNSFGIMKFIGKQSVFMEFFSCT